MRSSITAFLLALALFLPSACKVQAEAKPHNFAKWEKEISAFEAADRVEAPPKGAIEFIGSSSIRKWKSLATDFPHHRVINRGFGGSEIIDSVHFADRIVIPYAPRLIVFYAGGNDINGGKSPDQVLADFKAFVEKVQAALPDTDIDYISIAGNPSRWAQVEKIKDANAKIAAYIEGKPHLKFIDVFPKMLGEDGQPKPDIFVADRLHMNPEGYKIWTSIITPLLPAADLP